MFDFVKTLTASPNGVLATRDGEAVRTRVFQFLFAEGKRIYFCTSTEKEVFRQLSANSNVSFCCYPTDFFPVLSIGGQAVFVNDLKVKTRVLEENPMIRGIYKSADNPVFAVFYVEVECVETFSFAAGSETHQI